MCNKLAIISREPDMHLRANQAYIYEYFHARIMQNCLSNFVLFLGFKKFIKILKKLGQNLNSMISSGHLCP